MRMGFQGGSGLSYECDVGDIIRRWKKALHGAWIWASTCTRLQAYRWGFGQRKYYGYKTTTLSTLSILSHVIGAIHLPCSWSSQVLITVFQFAVTFPSAAITDCKLLFSNFRHLLIRLAYAMIQCQTKTRVRSNHIRLLSTCEILHPKIISNAPRRKNSRGSISLRTCVVRTYNRWR